MEQLKKNIEDEFLKICEEHNLPERFRELQRLIEERKGRTLPDGTVIALSEKPPSEVVCALSVEAKRKQLQALRAELQRLEKEEAHLKTLLLQHREQAQRRYDAFEKDAVAVATLHEAAGSWAPQNGPEALLS